jgi:hypothetical protein
MGWALLVIPAVWCVVLAYKRKKTPGAPPPLDIIEIICDYLVMCVGLWAVYQVYMI